MNNKWGSPEAKQSAEALVLGLKEVTLNAVPEYFQEDRDPSEILGEIFVALKKCYPNEYQIAFKRAVTQKCKDCGEPAKRRAYCNRHYQVHYRAGDFG